MSIQTLPQDIPFGTQIGQQLGKTLNEQLPQEIGKYRLSTALQSLKEKGINDPLQQAAFLTGPGGATLQQLKEFLPMIQSSNVVQEALREHPQKRNIEREKPVPGTEPLFGKQASPERLLRTPEAIEQGASDLIRRYPQRYVNNQAAARERYLENVQAQEGIIQDTASDFDNISTQQLQKNPNSPYSKIPGEISEIFKRKAEDYSIDERLNLSPKQAAQKASQEMLDFYKTRNLLSKDVNSKMQAILGEGPKNMEEIRKAYQKNGLGHLLVNDLINGLDMSRPVAASVAQPPNEKAAKFFRKIKPVSLGGEGGFSEKEKKRQEKDFEEAANLLTPDDSIYSFAYRFHKKGYNGNDFINYINKNPPNNLTNNQEIEAGQPSSFRLSLGDIFYKNLSGWKD